MLTYAKMIVEIRSTTALHAAANLGALVARVGIRGADGHAWLCNNGRWLHDDGYERVPCAASDVPPDVEVIDWPGYGHRAAELDAQLAEIAAARLDTLAGQAAAAGKAEEFYAAAESCQFFGLLDETLYERLTATRAEVAPDGCGESYADEDEGSDR